MDIGEKIKTIRNEKRYTQEQFGALLGFKKQTVSSYENAIAKPSVDFFVKLFEVCNVNLNWLIADSGEMFVNSEQPKINLTAVDEEQIKRICNDLLKKKGLI